MPDTASLLQSMLQRYPAATLQDVRKFLYQSAFGCEHLIGDVSAAEDYIAQEAASLPPAVEGNAV